MAKLIIATAGEMGCGKGTVVRYLVEQHGASAYKYSNMLRDILNRLHLPQTRDNIANTSQMIRQTFGEDIMEKALIADMTNDTADIVVLDGVRRKEDIQELLTMPAFKLIFIDADEKARYERIVKRAENPGDESKTFEKFLQEHKANADSRIGELRQYANHVIDNCGTQQQLYRQVDEIINNI